MNRKMLILCYFISVIVIIMSNSCKKNDDTTQRSNVKKPDIITETVKQVEAVKPKTLKQVDANKPKIWKLGDLNLNDFLEEYIKYASFEGNAGLNMSYFLNLVSDDCKIITHAGKTYENQTFTETPFDYVTRIGRAAFSYTFYEFLVTEPKYEIKNDRAVITYTTCVLDKDSNGSNLKTQLCVEIVDEKLKATSVTINVSEPTEDELKTAKKLLEERLEKIKKPKRYYINPGGESFFSEKPSITSDGKFVLYRNPSNIEGKIYLLETDTKKATLLEKLPSKDCNTQFFMPDNENIFITSKINGLRNQKMPINDKSLKLWGKKDGEYTLSTFSPDGKKVLIISNELTNMSDFENPNIQNEIIIEEANCDGTEFKTIFKYPAKFLIPKYSSKGNKIVMLNLIISSTGLSYEILCVDKTGENVKSLLKHADSLNAITLLDDMNRLYFVKATPQKRLYYLDIDDKKTTIVKSTKNWDVIDTQVSNCGKYFFFVSTADNNRHELYLMNLTNKNLIPTKLTKTDGMLSDFSVSHDGQWIVFTVELEGKVYPPKSKMFIMKKDGSNMKLIANLGD